MFGDSVLPHHKEADNQVAYGLTIVTPTGDSQVTELVKVSLLDCETCTKFKDMGMEDKQNVWVVTITPLGSFFACAYNRRMFTPTYAFFFLALIIHYIRVRKYSASVFLLYSYA